VCFVLLVEGDAFDVELVSDGLHAASVGILAEDPAHDVGFSLVNLESCWRVALASAPFIRHGDCPVAEETAAGAHSARPLEAAVRLRPEIVEVELVDDLTRARD